MEEKLVEELRRSMEDGEGGGGRAAAASAGCVRQSTCLI